MSQISPPIRILLLVSVVFMAAWFTVLKPGEEEIAVPAAVGGPASAAGEFQAEAQAGKAAAEQDALGAANAGIEEDGAATGAAAAPSAAAPSATGTRSASPAATAATPALAAVPARSLAGLPEAIRDGIAERKVIVLGVLNTAEQSWASMADDDRAVRSALRDVNRYKGGVVVRTVPITRLARYDGMVKALNITQSPTVVVVDRNRAAVALTGYVDRVSINQAIVDARRGSTVKLIKDPYLIEVNRLCGERNVRTDRLSSPTVRGAERAALARIARAQAVFRRSLARVDAPSRWRSLKSAMVARLAADERLLAGLRRAIASRDRARIARARAAIETGGTGAAALDRRFNAVGLTNCTTVRTQ